MYVWLKFAKLLNKGGKMDIDCWVCNGSEPKAFTKKCKIHDVCETKRAGITGIPWGTRTGFICQTCETKRIGQAISDFEKEYHDKWDFKHNDEIKCPFCGYEYYSDELYESTDSEECPNCNNLMVVDVDYSVSYSTYKP